jgi:7,8-dihydropterin-6-yl-methyl-4-(beta-D-ribofuranosyl)aminobenzene 5'-phosphate synthase
MRNLSLSQRPRRYPPPHGIFVETEFVAQAGRGLKLSGKCLCCAAHGLSCLITAHEGERSRTLLFDTGPEDWVFERNVVRLGADIGAVEAMVLSHGHWDHAGAMVRALQIITERNGDRDVPAYMHPDMFYSRALKMPDGKMFRVEDVPSIDSLFASHADVIVTTEEQSILDGSFYVSGEIPRVTAFERGLPGQHRLNRGGVWEPDELTKDERFVAVHVAGKGLVVFTACSHAGLINVLTEAGRRFPEIPLYGVLGGFHFAGVTGSRHPADSRSARVLRPRTNRGRALHGLAGDRRPRGRLRGQGRPLDCGEAVHIIEEADSAVEAGGGQVLCRW